MSLTAAEAELRFDRPAQIRAGLIAAAFVALFWHLLDFIPPDLGTVAHRWIHELDWSHGPIIPLFSAYLVYLRRDQIKRAPVRHTWVGLVIMLAALALYQYSLWGVRERGSQSVPRPSDGPAPSPLSRVRVGPQSWLRDRGSPGGATEAWAFTSPPQELRGGRAFTVKPWGPPRALAGL